MNRCRQWICCALFIFSAQVFANEAIPLPDMNDVNFQGYLDNNLWSKISPARLPMNYVRPYFTNQLRAMVDFQRSIKSVVPGEKTKLVVSLRASIGRQSLISCDFTLYYHSPEWGWLVTDSVTPDCRYN